MLVSWNWLKEYLGDTTLTANSAAELLGAHAFEIEAIKELEDDVVIDIDVLPNRSSDCLSHRGIARELASITGTPLAHDPLATPAELPTSNSIEVAIEDAGDCPRFTAMLIEDIEVKPSPEWLQKRLVAIGQRPINNIVDATNYVMFVLGQPLHAYDADLFPAVDGVWKFAVRKARPGETVSLIAEGGKDEDRDVSLTGSELLIVDASSDTPIGLAGVKGGRFAGVHERTQRVIIEAAHFHPSLTRRTARGLGIVIDASKRFENEPSRELPLYAQAAIATLITDIAGGEVQGVHDVYPNVQAPVSALVRPEKVNTLLGLALPKDKMMKILLRTGAKVKETDEGLVCTGPMERTDLAIEEDFIEEIGRLHGYDHVKSIEPQPVATVAINTRHYYSETIRQHLIGQGFSEVITSSFRKKDQVQLLNALASDKSYMRSALTKNLTEVLDKNAAFTDLLGVDDTRVFEIGTVFSKSGRGVHEHVSLALGVRLRPSGYTGKEDKILQKVLFELESILPCPIDWHIEKGVAETSLTKLLETLAVPTTYDEVVHGQDVVYQPFSLYPAMSRDIAMWVSEGTEVKRAEVVLNEAAGELRVRTTHVDEFTKDGRTSLAFRLVFQAPDQTLTDTEVNAVMDEVYKAAQQEGWETR